VVLLAAAVVGVWVREPSHRAVEAVVSAALVVILFDGGLQIGVRRFRSAAGGILSLGVVGTFLTVAGAALLAHELLDVSWYLAVLVATAVSPTDPAVVFSVLGQRQLTGRAGTVLEGESGANDPVGIALLAGLLSAGSLSGGAVSEVAGTFALQMLVGVAVGVVGGRGLVVLMRRGVLPARRVHLLHSMVGAAAVFGVATVLHGSGFLAVFVAGILLGDEDSPYTREVHQLHSRLASLGEVVAFVALGLTVDLGLLAHHDVWVPGLVLFVLLALVVRPLLVAPLLLPARLPRGESLFVLLAGLKGAVPLLLGLRLVPEHGGERLYGVVVVVVVLSVVVQGAAVPWLVRRLRVP
jgi:cell volume regulation protein A